MFILFADVPCFSMLSDERYPEFLTTLNQVYQEVLRGLARRPSFINTWGDGLHCVFGDVIAAADFALSLNETMAGVDWENLGLPPETNVRIGLHAGPVYPMQDPILGRTAFVGGNITLAARIEPIARAGTALVSREFAEYLGTTPGHAFVCRYVGFERLAKGKDRCHLFRLGYR